MTTIIITEKTSQKKDLQKAIGNKYGEIYPAEGHLLSLQEPQSVNGSWSKWSFDLLKPDDFYPTCPAPDGSPSAKNKLAAIENALKKAEKVILATDCDREGQLIGEELLRHYKFGGTVERAMFTAQDEKTLRDAFQNLEPNDTYQNLGQAAIARQQADQVYNLSLTRVATLALKEPGQYGAIGIGRVKTPTMAIVCMRELEIQSFEKSDFYHIIATATTGAGELKLKYAPKEKITDPEIAEGLRNAAESFEGPLKTEKKIKKTKPPKLLDLPELQKICSRKWGWTANKTLDVAQELYDGDGKKIQTYPRAESRYLAENQIDDIPMIVQGLKHLPQFKEVAITDPIVRKGKGGHFSDEALKGVSHHAIVPNKNTMDRIASIYPRLSEDEKKMFDLVASSYLAVLMPDYVYESTSVSMDVPAPDDKTVEYKIIGNIPKEQGWKSVYTDVMEKKEEHAGELPPVQTGDMAKLMPVETEIKKTKPPARFNEGSLIDAMQNAWKFVEDKSIQERLKEAKGIGTPATRAAIIAGLKMQGFLYQKGKHILPSDAGLNLFKTLKATAPELVDPGVTAQWEMKLDDILLGKQSARAVWDEIGDQTSRLINAIRENAPKITKIVTGVSAPKGKGKGKPTDKMKAAVKSIATNKGLSLPKGYTSDFQVCKDFLDEHIGGKPADPLKTMEKRLGSGVIEGINEKLAKTIVEAFGLESQKIIEETPERLKEVKGISAAKIKAITTGLEDKRKCDEIATYLQDGGVATVHALRLYKTYRDETLSTLKDTPYQTIREIKSFGFENADRLAQKAGFRQDNPERAKAALIHALNQANGSYVKEKLFKALEKRLQLSFPQIEAAVQTETEAKNIEEKGDTLFLSNQVKASQKLRKLFKALLNGPSPWGELDAGRALDWVTGKQKLSLSPEDRQAVQQILSTKAMALDLVPGASLDNAIQALFHILQAKGQIVQICAPTQGSAKQLATDTTPDVVSVSKLLEWTAKTQKFKRTARKQLECNLLIIKDAHLLEQGLFLSLLEATPKETAVLFLYDAYEKPQPQAQTGFIQCLENSDITRYALPPRSTNARTNALLHIRQGNTPHVPTGCEDLFLIEASNPQDAMRKLVEIVKNRLPNKFKFDAIKDIQVISPQVGGEVGSFALNRALQHHLNPAPAASRLDRFGKRFQTGDKVICCEPDLDRELLAGDIGLIKSLDQTAQSVSISFSGKSKTFQLDELDYLEPAFAISSAKAQYIDTKAVVICTQNLEVQSNAIYNAISYAKDLAIILQIK